MRDSDTGRRRNILFPETGRVRHASFERAVIGGLSCGHSAAESEFRQPTPRTDGGNAHAVRRAGAEAMYGRHDDAARHIQQALAGDA
jgi:hypothetical protein